MFYRNSAILRAVNDILIITALQPSDIVSINDISNKESCPIIVLSLITNHYNS
jgi:hypothetical protein